jgi:hypothetical protein
MPAMLDQQTGHAKIGDAYNMIGIGTLDRAAADCAGQGS